MHFFVYIIECQNTSFYTGYTTNLERRYQEHVKGTSKCKYTRAFPPKALKAAWGFATKSEALTFEAQIKKLSKGKKQKLIHTPANNKIRLGVLE
jgi:putative endonuclease